MSAAPQTSGNMMNGSFIYPPSYYMMSSSPFCPPPSPKHHVYMETAVSSSISTFSSSYPLCSSRLSSFSRMSEVEIPLITTAVNINYSSISLTSNQPLTLMPKTAFFHPQQNSPHPHHSSGQPILLDNQKQFLNFSQSTSLHQPFVEGGEGVRRRRTRSPLHSSFQLYSNKFPERFPPESPPTIPSPRRIMNMIPETSSSSSSISSVKGSSNLTRHEIGGRAMLCIPREGTVITGITEKYELIKRLQKNAYGAVYQAKGLSSHDDVAVKVLSKKTIKEKELDRVLPETPLAEVFFAPLLQGQENFLSIREVFEYPACHFIVSDLAEGEDLCELLKHYPCGLPEKLVASFIRQAAQGLLQCHQQGLALQDFSLENCLLFFEREKEEAPLTVRVKVCDPGQAVRFRIDLRTGEEIPVPYKGCVGKTFRPPEIFLKGKEYLASKVDAWCLGWSTFKLLFAVPIFDSVCPAEGDFRSELFLEENYNELFAHLGVLHHFSQIGQDFVLRLLDPIPHQRMSIAEALQHPFLATAEDLPVYVHNIPPLHQRFENYHQNTNNNNSGMMRVCGNSELQWLTPREKSKTRKESTMNNSSMLINLLKLRKKPYSAIIPKIYFTKYEWLYCTSDKPSGVNNN